MQTLLIGLDAACFPVLNPLFEDGDLPNLHSVLNRGTSGRLESQIPPWTASAWPSLYTGMNPGKHGVFDFLRFDGYDWDIVNATSVRQRSLWEYADEAGLTSVVVNVPVTSPPSAIDGAVIPGYLASEDPDCHPEGILQDLRNEIGGYRIYARGETDERVGEEKFDEYLKLTRIRGEAFQYLANRYDPEFGFIQFQKTDAVFHDFPGDDAKVRQIYRAVDDVIGTLLDAHDPSTVIVASDHGMGKYDGHEFRVNQFLRERGVVETTTGGKGVPSWFQIKDEQLTEADRRSADRQLVRRMASLASELGLTYQRGKAILERIGIADFVGRHVPVSAVFAASEAVDFERSAAYLRSPSELGIRLNLEGREPEGAVPADQYEAVRDEIIDDLSQATTPSGDPVFEDVARSEKFFSGQYTEEAVDVLTVPANFENSLSALIGREFDEPEPYNHKLHGLIAVAGNDVTGSDPISGAHLFDVAPTVLASLGISPNEKMDGSPVALTDAPAPDSYPEYVPQERSTTEDAAVAQRLSDLGYLE